MKTKATLFALTTLLLSSSAFAADVFSGDKSLKDDKNYASGDIVNWSGFYVGAQAGYGIATRTWEDSPFGESFESPILGAIAGYDISRGRFVFGAFGEYNYITADEAEDVSDWAVGLRGGVLLAPRTLLYTSVAYAHLSDDDDDVNGIRAAIGTEFALSGNLFADLKANYTWYDLDDANDIQDAGDLRVLGGMKLKLNGFGN